MPADCIAAADLESVVSAASRLTGRGIDVSASTSCALGRGIDVSDSTSRLRGRGIDVSASISRLTGRGIDVSASTSRLKETCKWGLRTTDSSVRSQEFSHEIDGGIVTAEWSSFNGLNK
ncbi:hypothetical protein CYMTET_51281 [Cymbomonas tetramitiformis]|uniref:Uncharacterized protein n=1 Tax=Cymbomonas tetramitiformis TaxID=36881 RepID=A0AAE0ESB0_9CHLO|nr:hypothetical protein CYMTET_51281 [Cymbomonas tetramitiformis]